MRLFFALLPDAAASRMLAETAATLDGEKWCFVPEVNYHVTLAFIGDVEDAAVPSIRELGAVTAAPLGGVAFSRCTYWPQSHVVVALGTDTAPALSDLAVRLQVLVAPHRLSGTREPRWCPHVTLARKVLQPPVLQAMSPIAWVARSFSLMRSERIAGRSVYTVVDTYPLLDKN